MCPASLQIVVKCSIGFSALGCHDVSLTNQQAVRNRSRPLEMNLEGNCIRIRRLFDAASGFKKLEESEHQHIHECQVCQGVFYIFIGLHSDIPPAASTNKTFAA